MSGFEPEVDGLFLAVMVVVALVGGVAFVICDFIDARATDLPRAFVRKRRKV